MFPFKVRFSKTINAVVKPEQINDLLDISRDDLRKAGADYFSREVNCLKFENRFFKFVSNWNLMIAIDGGYFEIINTKDTKTKIRYGVTLTRIWIMCIIMFVVLNVSTKDIFYSIKIFSLFIIISWSISVLRHWILIQKIGDKLKKKLIN
jgi:hypothetical protein